MAMNGYEALVEILTRPCLIINKVPPVVHEHKHVHLHLGDEEITIDDPRFGEIVKKLSKSVDGNC